MISSVERAADLDDLLTRLAGSAGTSRVLAGGTDLLLSDPGDGQVALIDLTRVESLGAIEESAGGVVIGAAVRLSAIVRSEVLAARFGALADAARLVAGPQIRNLATLAGNVCNASPSADTVPPLLVYDAIARLRSASGHRELPLQEFFTGPGKTVLEPGEILEALVLPWPADRQAASYTKVSPRRAMDLAVVGVAVGLADEAGRLKARIALGAVAPTPIRATAAEELVEARGVVDAGVAAEAGALAEEAASPIDDVRGSARYRRAMVRRIVTRDLLEAARQLSGGAVRP